MNLLAYVFTRALSSSASVLGTAPNAAVVTGVALAAVAVEEPEVAAGAVAEVEVEAEVDVDVEAVVELAAD